LGATLLYFEVVSPIALAIGLTAHPIAYGEELEAQPI
jgi:hypothetical protein